MERFQSRPSPAVLVMSCRSINFVSTWSGRLAALNMLDISEDVTPRALILVADLLLEINSEHRFILEINTD